MRNVEQAKCKKKKKFVFYKIQRKKMDHFVPDPSVEGKMQQGKHAVKRTFFDAFWP